MNKKISIASSIILSISIFIFLISQVLSIFIRGTMINFLAYGSCIILSWAYIVTVIGNSILTSKDRMIAAEAGKLFAVIYSVYVSIVYFSQLTVVNQNVLSTYIIDALSFEVPGSWLFSLDLIGYGIMALSTFFVGLTIEPKDKPDKVLKWMLLLHGIFVTFTIMPMTPIFVSGNNSGNYGVYALISWCLIFLPMAILFVRRFKNASKSMA